MRFPAKTGALQPGVPVVAVLGRPNVGKSTLFNRIVGGRPALVHDVPGVTRDRRYRDVEFEGKRFTIVDTGGLDPQAPDGAVTEGIHRQAHQAIAESDLVVFVVDARAGLTPTDREVAQILRKTGRPVVVAANKVDTDKQDSIFGEIYELGLGDVFPVSAAHGRGADELLDAILAKLPEAPPPAIEPHDAPIRLAFVGRPNVGKSSMVNRILGEERVLVHDQPGTTTDPVDTPFELDGRRYVLVDTAGMRRKARVHEVTEKLAVSMAMGQLERADVALLVIDVTEGAGDQDARIARAVHDHGRALVIVLNKVDTQEGDSLKKIREQIEDQLEFVGYAPIVQVSARTGQGVMGLLDLADQVFAEHGKRVATAELNRFFETVLEVKPPPIHKGKPVRIHYLTQPQVHPPSFVLWANYPERLTEHYRRFIANQLREHFGFRGSPIRILVRDKKKTMVGDR